MNTFHHNRAAEARRITTAVAILCAVACIGAVIPAVEHAVTAVLLVLAGLVLAALGLRYGARWVRERREDRADALYAARWRATHAPHLVNDRDRAALARVGDPIPARGVRAGVA
jgi:hypothetical protein